MEKDNLEIKMKRIFCRLLKSLSYRSARRLLYFSQPSEHPDFCLKSILNHLSINVIIDIGANKGQFRNLVRSSGYKNLILSFEPLIDAHDFLLKKSIKDNLWIIWENLAIGAKEEEVKFYKTRNSVSSSISYPSGIEKKDIKNQSYSKDIEIIDTYNVKVITLDSIKKKIINISRKFYKNLSIHLKIDVEG